MLLFWVLILVLPVTLFIYIDSNGTPDTFAWADNNGECSGGSGIPITGTPEILCNGISVNFAATTGHGGSDYWAHTITIGPSNIISTGNSNFPNNSYFKVDAAGDITRLKNLSYSWPTYQNAGVLTNDGSGNLSWTVASSSLPSQTGNSGKYLMTNGTTASWETISGGGLVGLTSGTVTYLGIGAGNGISSGGYDTILGHNAGAGSTTTYGFNTFIGYEAGYANTNSANNVFIGRTAGRGVSVERSQFIGIFAGWDAISASYSNFMGYQAGRNATNAQYSNFFGENAGYGATNARNSIFIGQNAGTSDTVNNTGNTNDFSILIGKSTSTGGYSNSIALGGSATNTAANQFMIGSSTRPIDQLVLNGSNAYFNFGSTGGSSGYGFRDNAGTLEYKNSGGAWAGLISSPISIGTTGNTLYSSGLTGTGQGSTNLIIGGNNIILGASAGNNATYAAGSNFFGTSAGSGATNVNNSNFFGQGSGVSATDASYSNFLGYNTGSGATNASSSNFFGGYSGQAATNAFDSNFFGYQAGAYGSSASYSNFFGRVAGWGASSAAHSNFFGQYSGYQATSASNSNFFGQSAGRSATNASYSNFLGYQAGYGAANAANSIFIGKSAGLNDTVNNTVSGSSIAIGDSAGTGGYSNSIALGAGAVNTATNQFLVGSSYTKWSIRGVNYTMPSSQGGASTILTNDGSGNLTWGSFSTSPVTVVNTTNLFSTGLTGTGSGVTSTNDSIFLGQDAGNGATSANLSNFFGQQAGYGATGAVSSNFFGQQAGYGATGSDAANFLGYRSGYNATAARFSNFLGYSAGNGATSASYANFFGANAGQGATGATGSNFFGSNAGQGATSASYSNFIGATAGSSATNASNANFIGTSAGQGATNASNANFFGYQVGQNASNASNANFFGYLAGNTATNAANSIFIGTYAGFGDTVNNTDSYDDFLTYAKTSILIGHRTSTGGYSNSIAIGAYATNTAANQFTVGSTNRPITQMFIQGSGNTCTLTTGTGWSCSSDERLKTNITDLTSDTLEKVLSLKTVNYNWIDGDNTTQQVGFLAQDLEQYFPQLVTTDPTGYKSVYYAQMTPILVEAIREMNIKITDIGNMETPNTWRDSLIAWLGNASNKITRIFTGEICLYDENGQTECINASQLRELKQNLNTTNQNTPSPTPESTPDPTPGTDPLTCTTPQVLNESGDACVDPVTDVPPPETTSNDTSVGIP